MLPNRRQIDGRWKPLPSVIHAAWRHASNEERMDRLAEHLGWAERHGGIGAIAEFIRSLNEVDWHQVTDEPIPKSAIKKFRTIAEYELSWRLLSPIQFTHDRPNVGNRKKPLFIYPVKELVVDVIFLQVSCEFPELHE